MKILTINYCNILILALAVFFSAVPLLAKETTRQPNIILILADDMGYGDCGASNPESKIKTPHIDKLAKDGLLFTDAHSPSSTCTPSRYGLLTGINPARTGVDNNLLNNGKPAIEETETTIAALLKDQGYYTAMVGKWHLGFVMPKKTQKEFDFSNPLTGGPLDRGFDEFFGVHSSPSSMPYFYIEGRHPVEIPSDMTRGTRKPSGKKRGEFDLDRHTSWGKGMIAPGFVHEEVAPTICERAVKIIRNHAASENKRPLFLYYSLTSPHEPWLPTEEFAGKSGIGVYADFVMQLDHEVGRISRTLIETGLEENTLVIFTSDNGATIWAGHESQASGHDVSGGLRGSKAFAYEGGHRVPFIAKWPGMISPGGVSDTTINLTDIFATLAEFFDLDVAKTYSGVKRDSHSFLSALYEPGIRFPRPPMVNTPDTIRIDDWKLVSKQRNQGAKATDPSKFDLFNLADDLVEENNIFKANQERAERSFEKYREFIDQRKLK